MPPALYYLGYIMLRQTQNTNTLNDAITQLTQKRPHLQPILNAFAPILHLKHQLLESNLFEGSFQSVIQDSSLSHDIPIVQKERPQLAQDVFEELARLLLKEMKCGFPQTQNRLEMLANEIMAGCIKASDLLTQPANTVHDLAVSREMDNQVVKLFMTILHKLVLTKWRTTISQQIAWLSWAKGCCPVCGSLPILSLSSGKGRPWLYCGTCGHEWQFPWAKCLACGQERPEEAEYFFVEDEKDEKAFVCRNCNRYILSVRVYEDANIVDLDLLSMSLIHLDIIMQQQGILPMTFSLWNDFTKGTA